MTTPLRRGNGRSYIPTHPQYQPGSMLRSCGKCGKHLSIAGTKRHRVLGYVCGQGCKS